MIPINRYLDAAILKPATTRKEATTAIRKCIALKARTVCIRPCDIPLAKELCTGTETGVCVVLGFPHGDQLSESKADEARRYVEARVDEIDMVVNYGFALSGQWDDVRKDIAVVVAVCKPAKIPLKVIFETAELDIATITRLTEISIEAGADFVKTSTGFNGDGATDEGVSAMMASANGRIKVKPSGGIRDRAQAEHFIAMGVHRLGVNHAACDAICGSAPAQDAGKSGY